MIEAKANNQEHNFSKYSTNIKDGFKHKRVNWLFVAFQNYACATNYRVNKKLLDDLKLDGPITLTIWDKITWVFIQTK